MRAGTEYVRYVVTARSSLRRNSRELDPQNIFLGIRKILILRSSYSFTRFLFLTFFRTTFFDFVRNEEFRAKFQKLIFSKRSKAA